MLLPCLHANLINFCFLALHPLCDFCFSPALFGDEIWRSSYQTWPCLQVCPGQAGYLATHGYPGLWGGLGAAQPGRTLLAHPRQQEEGKSELKNILQTLDKPHIFSFNQFIWRRGELRMKGGIFLFLWVITVSNFTYWSSPECVWRQIPTQCVAIEGQLNYNVLERIVNVIWDFFFFFN